MPYNCVLFRGTLLLFLLLTESPVFGSPLYSNCHCERYFCRMTLEQRKTFEEKVRESIIKVKNEIIEDELDHQRFVNQFRTGRFVVC